MNRSALKTGEPSRARASQKSARTDELKNACTNEALPPFQNKSRSQKPLYRNIKYRGKKNARYIYINENTEYRLPVVPRKAVVEVSKIGNL